VQQPRSHGNASRTHRLARTRLLLTLAVIAPIALSACEGSQGVPGVPGPPGPQGPPGPPASIDDGTSAEGCLGCHGAGGVAPVGDISSPGDVHFVDLDPDGPLTASGYRQLSVDVTSVDLSGASAVVEFDVTDEDGAAVTDLFASDGRFNLARLLTYAQGDPGVGFGDPSRWETLLFSERFTTAGGLFEYLGGASYRYTSAFDPGGATIAPGDTLRLAVQVSASDLPAGNGWCDFDATLAGAESCNAPVTRTRDVVQTAVCNDCHGVTSDTRLAFHGGGRTEVEYCVTCHNPGIGETDFTNMIHKIHYGAQLENGYRDYSCPRTRLPRRPRSRGR